VNSSPQRRRGREERPKMLNEIKGTTNKIEDMGIWIKGNAG